MTRTRYTMSARSQGELHMQRRRARLVEEGIRRRVFVCDMDPDAETPVRGRPSRLGDPEGVNDEGGAE